VVATLSLKFATRVALRRCGRLKPELRTETSFLLPILSHVAVNVRFRYTVAMKSFALLLSASLLLCVACRQRENTSTFISAPGQFDLFGGDMKVNVTQATNGAITSRVAVGSAVAGSPRSQFRAGQPWFIFPQTSTNAWIFDGRSNITHIEFKDGAARMTPSQRAPGVWAQIPAAVRQRLPAELRDKQ
jgi:hypothetical protein